MSSTNILRCGLFTKGYLEVKIEQDYESGYTYAVCTEYDKDDNKVSKTRRYRLHESSYGRPYFIRNRTRFYLGDFHFA